MVKIYRWLNYDGWCIVGSGGKEGDEVEVHSKNGEVQYVILGKHLANIQYGSVYRAGQRILKGKTKKPKQNTLLSFA